MDVHNGIVSTVITEGFFYERIKGISLTACGERSRASEHFIYESTAKLLGIFCVIQKSVDICAPVIEYREKEAQIRHFYDPVTDTVFDVVGFSIVAQSRFGKVDRTDTAEDMIVDLIRSIKHFLAVGGFARDIINGMDQNNIIVLAVVIVFDDLIIKFLQNGIVLKFAAAEFHKKFLCAALFFLVERKLHVDQVFADGSGKSFLEYFKVFEHFFLRKRKKSFFQFGFFIFFTVNIAAADTCDRAVVWRKLFLNFGYFFFVHYVSLLIYRISVRKASAIPLKL